MIMQKTIGITEIVISELQFLYNGSVMKCNVDQSQDLGNIVGVMN